MRKRAAIPIGRPQREETIRPLPEPRRTPTPQKTPTPPAERPIRVDNWPGVGAPVKKPVKTPVR